MMQEFLLNYTKLTQVQQLLKNTTTEFLWLFLHQFFSVIGSYKKYDMSHRLNIFKFVFGYWRLNSRTIVFTAMLYFINFTEITRNYIHDYFWFIIISSF